MPIHQSPKWNKTYCFLQWILIRIGSNAKVSLLLNETKPKLI